MCRPMCRLTAAVAGPDSLSCCAALCHAVLCCCFRYEEVATLPPDVLRQPLALQSAAVLNEGERMRGLLRGRWRCAAKSFVCATTPAAEHSSDGHHQEATAAAAAAADVRQAAGAGASAVDTTLAQAADTALRRTLLPVPHLDTPAQLHWSVAAHQRALAAAAQAAADADAAAELAGQASAAAAAAGADGGGGGGKKRSAAAAALGQLGGPASKKLAAELAAGGDGTRWWFLPGEGGAAEQVRPHGLHVYTHAYPYTYAQADSWCPPTLPSRPLPTSKDRSQTLGCINSAQCTVHRSAP